MKRSGGLALRTVVGQLSHAIRGSTGSPAAAAAVPGRSLRQGSRLTPEHQVRALLRYRWAVLALVVLGGTGAGLTSALQTPMYRASVQLFFAPNFPTSDITKLNDGGNYILQRVRSYAEVVDSPQLASAVIQRLRLPYRPAQLTPHIVVTTKAGTAVMEIAVLDSKPARARDIANAIADEFPGFLDRIEKPTGSVATPVKVSVVRRATTPSSPDSPRTRTNVALGLLIGFAVGAGTAVFRYARERAVLDERHAADIAATNLLGVVPSGPRAQPSAGGEADPKRTESLRQLRTNVRLRAAGKTLRSITVLGSAPGEDRTAAAADLAIAFARAGETVVLVDGDLCDPCVHRCFAVPNTVGLCQVLGRAASFNDAAQQWQPDLPLYLLPAGPLAGETGAKLLQSAELGRMMNSFELGSVLVVINSPALLSDAEAMLLVRQTDAVVLVAQSELTPVDQLSASRDVLRALNANVLGVVVVRRDRRRGQRR